ncbi:MAG: ChbG/HpnK family deacetylase [Planctomycetaceae bacterium]|jgi:predicted glycoside hydrolase/deacetylase ChbG (UPF0249 family)|nr:ChbG/HpnK family deacetylase [Planctomycetaceae bacterium]
MLIITADDLGFSVSRNTAILEAVQFGSVSSASLMVNMPEAENACLAVRKYTPQLRVGLHFTLTSGRPVAAPQHIPLLIDANGLFRRHFLSLWSNVARPEFLEQVQIEFNAQLQLMNEFEKRYKIQTDHLDSHQHIHAIPPIGNLLTNAANARGLAVRVPCERYGNWKRFFPLRTLLPIGDVKMMILNFCAKNMKQDHCYFGALDSGKMDWNAWNRIFEIVRYSPIRCEVNVHPGCLVGKEAATESLCCSQDDKNFHCNNWRRRELNVLLDPNFIETLQKNNLFPLQTW